MALVLDANPGSVTANTYALLVDAEAYALTLPVVNSWSGATDPQKNAALVQATRMMDAMRWVGLRGSVAQPLQWPRTFVVDREGWFVSSSTIPTKIRDACCEFAIRLIADDRAADSGGLTPETLKVGSIDLGRLRRNPIPASVLEMINEFMVGGGQPLLVRS